MASYAAYGLEIDSEIALPELEPIAAHEADILIRRGAVAPTSAKKSDDYVRVDAETVVFHTPHGGFRIVAGREITVDPAPGINSTSLRLILLGRALGAALQWRGRLVLHASAVARNGRVRIFAGASGSGKSTAAAALLNEGYSLVADDLVAIDLDAPEPCVLPAYAQVRLWPDSAALLGLDIERLDRVHPALEKRLVALEPGVLVRTALPIDSITVLERGTDMPTEHLDRHAALAALLRHCYAPRIMRALGRQAEHFAQCARLAASIPVERRHRR